MHGIYLQDAGMLCACLEDPFAARANSALQIRHS